MAKVELNNLVKSFGKTQIINGVNLTMNDGEFVVLVGPSGCGKSTLLRLIAGLETITDGEVRIGDTRVNDLPSSKRNLAMVFQSYALYPHLSIFENIAFGMRISGEDKEQIKERVEEVADILKVSEQLTKLPKQLSGGQRQRVAIARALVRKPQLYLFDEPLSNLDASLRIHTRVELAKLHQQLQTTMVYVTHDQVEAMTLADKIVVLNKGRVEQYGTPMELYFQPQNIFVAGFIGSPSMNFFSATIENKTSKATKLHLQAQKTSITGPQCEQQQGESLVLGIRSEDIRVTDQSSAMFSGTVELVESLGEYNLVHFRVNENTLYTLKVPAEEHHDTNETIHLKAETAKIHIFNQDGERVCNGY